MDKTAEAISVGKVSDFRLLEQLSDEWKRLYEGSASTTPFQSPDWIIPWWKVFGAGKLFILYVRHNQRLIGFAPLYIYRLKDSGLRQAALIGTGNSDYLDILSEDGFAEIVTEAIYTYLAANHSEWDICYFQGLKEKSPLLKIREAAGITIRTMPFEVCPVSNLPENIEELFSVLPVSFRKNTIRARNNLDKQGELTYETATDRTLDEFLFNLFKLHKKSWEGRNASGVLDGEAIKTFHRESSKRFLKSSSLRLSRLRYNGKAIAAAYSMIKYPVLYYYIGGFDPDMKKFSPGSVLLLYIMEDIINAGFKQFDFLMGAEEYKYNWGAKDKRIFKMIISKVHG